MKKELHWIYGMALFLVMGIVFLALFAPWIAPYDPTAVSTEEILEGMSSSHWLGTDALGRDILSRTIYGARTSVAFAFVAAFCTMVLGLMLGILSGYFGGWVDRGNPVSCGCISGTSGDESYDRGRGDPSGEQFSSHHRIDSDLVGGVFTYREE